MSTVTVPDWPVTHRLRRAIEVAGIDRPALANAAHVSIHTVDNWMRGSTRPNYATMRLIADVTGVPVWWLMGAASEDEASTKWYESEPLPLCLAA